MTKKTALTLDTIDKSLLQNEEMDVRWFTSPFRELKHLHAKQQGKRYEEITRSVLEQAGYKIATHTDTDYDMVMDGKKCEIKGSTVIKGHNDKFSFLQIRPEQQYDELVFSCFYFDKLEIYKISKQRVMELVELGRDDNNKGKRGRAKKGETKPTVVARFKKQHGGNDAESGTFCYHGNPKDFGAEHVLTIE